MPDLEIRLTKIYNGLKTLNAPLPSLKTFKKNTVMFFPCGGGGIAFTKDDDLEYGEYTIWVHVYCPYKMPKIESMRNMLLLASCTRARSIAAYVTNPKIVSLLKRYGFRKATRKVWLLKCSK